MTLRALTLLAFATALAACSGSVSYTPGPTPTVAPNGPSIDHVIVMVQENRSFNNLFMNYPGASTSDTGACKPVTFPHGGGTICADRTPVKLSPITLETCRCPGGTDIGHDHAIFETEYDGGKMDGFDDNVFGTTGQGGPAKFYPYAYVERKEVQPYWDMAKQYTLGDMMFSTDTTDSFVAHQQVIAGTAALNGTESLVDTPSGFPWGCDAAPGTKTSLLKTNGKVYVNQGPFPCFTQYKTMADVLDAAKVSWKYYVDSYGGSSPDFSGLVWNGYDAIKHVRYGPDWKKNISEPNTTVFADIKRGTLPNVSWVIPSLACSDHPASGDNKGPSWIANVVNAVGKSKYWNSTAIVVIWDDWGGFYDNVPPPQISYTSLGMRVPLLVISKWSKHGQVVHTQYDFGSVLRFIEQNFGTGNLGTSDVSANSLFDSFDFSQAGPPFKPIAAQYPVSACAPAVPLQDPRKIIEADGGAPD